VTDDTLPRYDPEDVAAALDGTAPAETTVVGVLLAGGTSTRFGAANKLLADLDGRPLVRHAARTLLGADLDEVVAVTGHGAEEVGATLTDLDVRFIHNPAYEEGLSTSVARGVEAARAADAALFLPGDMPDVDPTTVRTLVDAHRAGLATALAAAYGDRRGNPVLFGREHFDALLAVEGDVGGRPVLLGCDRAALVATDDPGVVADVDTTDDLRRRR
jgi:molybdenum cofactor cytidylyltransferase